MSDTIPTLLVFVSWAFSMVVYGLNAVGYVTPKVTALTMLMIAINIIAVGAITRLN